MYLLGLSLSFCVGRGLSSFFFAFLNKGIETGVPTEITVLGGQVVQWRYRLTRHACGQIPVADFLLIN